MSTMTGEAAKFLIVDDSRAIQSIIKRAIEGCNYPKLEIQTATDAEAAMNILEGYRPDLIITDWHMHKISGLEFCQHVCQTYGKKIPIGFVTTESAAEKIDQAYQSGARFVINKPFQDIDLRSKILEIIPVGGITEQPAAIPENLATSHQMLSSMLKGQAFTLEPCPPLGLTDLTENNFIGLFGENGKTPPVNALAIMEMNAVGLLWALNNEKPEMLKTILASGGASNDQLDEARRFMDEFGAGMSIGHKNGPLKLARSSIVSRQFPRLEMSLKSNAGRMDYRIHVPEIGTGFITYIKLL
ncbi:MULTISPECIES: response regulator [unclassified Methylophilus]|uniref:response regulator n=1 Tax=unclassified Methylophilus TaxID=2630143 RepID=UPI00188EB44D|nr:response regulator [Methylophilus sp. 13]MBF5037962.1 response regulator [Methylophilus sp. 13]BEV08115.1 response regulator [Methylophilus sp. DW102]